jgi:hypothetical protein
MTLPRPQNIKDLDMWVDESIWGHRLYNDQTPWLTLLEFLGVVQSELKEGRAFAEAKLNTLSYTPYSRLYVRNIIFNNPELEVILAECPDDHSRWTRWVRVMGRDSGGIPQPEYAYLKERFDSFKDFAAVVKFLQSSAIEGDSNKRWSSKFVFPYGPHCLYEDLRVDGISASNDRRFFARTGELFYLMLCRGGKGDEILQRLQRIGVVSDRPHRSAELSMWNRMVAALQPESDLRKTREIGSPPYLPHEFLPEYLCLSNDWLRLFDCALPDYDVLPHLATITGVHLIIYLLAMARRELTDEGNPSFVLEIIAPRKTVIRDLAVQSFRENDRLSLHALQDHLNRFSQTPAWKNCFNSVDPLGAALNVLRESFNWPEKKKDKNKARAAGSPNTLLAKLKEQAEKRHKSHLGKCHGDWAREIGLASSRGSKSIRYAPTDSLLKTLVFSTVVGDRLEFQEFLHELHRKYGYIIGDAQAQRFIEDGLADRDDFAENARRLEQRLASMGLLKRLSDACAYVLNPLHTEGIE